MLDQLFSMKGKTCVVTGGSRGLGYYMAKGFLSAGAKRVSMEEISALVKQLSEKEKFIDVLVNNAGTGWMEKLEDFSEIGWDRVMDLNVKSPFFLTKELIPLLSANASHESTASVINIGSVSGICGETDPYSYAPSKAAIHQLTRGF